MFTHVCGASWTGNNRSHCGSCHYTFGGTTSFDRHRQVVNDSTGRSVVGKKCLPPESLGLVDNGEGVWVGEYAA